MQATSEDSLEHSEVSSPHWSGVSRWGDLPKSLGKGTQPWEEPQSYRWRCTSAFTQWLIQVPISARKLASPFSPYLGKPKSNSGCCSVSQTRNSYQINKTRKKCFLTPSCSGSSSPCRALNVTKACCLPSQSLGYTSSSWAEEETGSRTGSGER